MPTTCWMIMDLYCLCSATCFLHARITGNKLPRHAHGQSNAIQNLQTVQNPPFNFLLQILGGRVLRL